jgi:uncharacterized protein involved in response to NO
MAGLFSLLAMLVWLGLFAGAFLFVSPYPPQAWHAHEMLFGFTASVIAGFLLTAAPNWTGTRPLAGRPLAALAGLWLAGRIAVWGVPAVPLWLAAVLDVAFLPALVLALLPALRKGSAKNFVFPVILGLLAAANLMFHLEALGIGDMGSLGLTVAVDGIALFIAVIGGRVTPAFTANALSAQALARGEEGEVKIASKSWLNEAAIASVALVIAADLIAPGGLVAGLIALAAALLNALRMAGWKTVKVLDQPILWVLHLGYGWLVLGLAVKGLGPLTGALAPAAALHGITVGAIGTMTLAMMSRASLGHTGRALEVGPVMAAAYLLPSLAALVRLITPVVAPAAYAASITVSGLLWTLAFAIFAALFVPILTRPRVDARPG